MVTGSLSMMIIFTTDVDFDTNELRIVSSAGVLSTIGRRAENLFLQYGGQLHTDDQSCRRSSTIIEHPSSKILRESVW
jgi:hypothetical protein